MIDYLIIGGGVAGTTAAEAIRSKDPDALITIISDEKYPLYSRIRIPAYLKGIRKREELFLRTFESYSEKKITLITDKSVSILNTSENFVETTDGSRFYYRKLLLTTGGQPKKLSKLKNAFSMQTLDDADKILEAIPQFKKGMVIGSGFIALEFVEAFLHHKLDTRLYVSEDGLWSRFMDRKVSDLILKLLEAKGVQVIKGAEPDTTSSDSIIGVGIGIDVAQSFIHGTGIAYDDGILVNEFLKTSAPNIYAAGDVARFHSLKLGKPVRFGNWTNAVASGRVAGFNMSGDNIAFDLLSAYSLTLDQLSIVFLGYPEIADNTKVKTVFHSESSCSQFLIRNGKLDAAILINRAEDRAKFSEILESRANFDSV